MMNERALDMPFWQKLNMTAYSNIGESTLRKLLAERRCPFLLKIGNKQLIKRKDFEKYLEGEHYIDM